MNPFLAWLAGEGIDVGAEKTGLKDRARGILGQLADAIIPPAAASDASAIQQPDVIPANQVMTPAQEQQVMHNADVYNGLPYRENGEPVGANAMLPTTAREPQVTQMQPTQLDDIQMQEPTFASNAIQGAKSLLTEVDEEAQNTPDFQKGALALASAQDLLNKTTGKDDGQDNGKDDQYFKDADNFLSKTFGSEEFMLSLALGFNSMRLNPDQGLATVIGKRLETLAENRGLNQTAASLEKINTPLAKKYAALIKANPKMAKEIYKEYLKEFAKGGMNFEDEQKLRKELAALPATSQLSEMSLSFNRIKKMAENPSPAGDLAMIFNYMKMLDPNSVVRESEFRTAEQARAWLTSANESGITIPSFVQQGIQRLEGKGTLLPEQRADFLNQAGNLYQGAYEGYQPEAERFTSMAKEYNMPAERIVRKFEPYQPSAKYQVGYTEGGYEYIGGDPAKQTSWKKVTAQ